MLGVFGAVRPPSAGRGWIGTPLADGTEFVLDTVPWLLYDRPVTWSSPGRPELEGKAMTGGPVTKLFDADNHYWETSEAFTRYRDPGSTSAASR